MGGVYKLVRFNERPKLKITSDLGKATLPDRKRLLRVLGGSGRFAMDVMTLDGETVSAGDTVYDPTNPSRHKAIPSPSAFEEVRQVVMDGGRVCAPLLSLEAASERCAEQLKRLPEGSLRLFNPHLYKVSMSRGIHELRSRLMAEMEEGLGENQ